MREYLIDVIGIIGVTMLAYGLWLISPIHMFVILGILFIMAALSAAYYNSGGNKSNPK